MHSMSLEEWIHDKDCLEHMQERWDYEKNILENERGMLAGKDFKGCQRIGCEESPQVEEEEASEEGLLKIQHVRADGMSRLAETTSVKAIDRAHIIVPFPGPPLPPTSWKPKSHERRQHLYAIRNENEAYLDKKATPWWYLL